MQKIKSGLSKVDPGFIIVVAICLLAIWPFISRQGLPQETDVELHIYRLAELSRLVRAGELFSRWAPNFYYGYGYPIFNYYAPLTYYLGLGFDFMPVLGPVHAVKALLIIGLIGAGIGMYGYMRQLWGRAAGLVSAAAYVYAPYILFVDPHARGDMAEAFSFATFSLALWAMDSLRRRPNAWSWMSSVILIGAIILTHNLMAMVFVAILAGWAIWQAIFDKARLGSSRQTGFGGLTLQYRLPLALLLGIGIAAFFWLTVALEQDAVNLSSLVGDGSHFDFRNHFLQFGELFRLPELIDWGATEPNFILAPGLVQLLLGGLGAAAVIFGWTRERAQAGYFALVASGLIFLMLSVSSFVWEVVPLLPFLQFPWRFLGALAAALAILGGAGTDALLGRLPNKMRLWTPAAIVGLIIMTSIPLIQVPPWPEDFGPTTAAQVLRVELAGRWLGTTSTADFVPATVDVLPRKQKSVSDAILNGQPIDRVNRETLPEGTDVITENLTPLHFRYHVSGNTEFPLRLFLFDFPGWRTKVDGEVVQTELGRPEGFIVIPMPAGEHVVDVEFGSTPARSLSLVVTLLSLVVTALVALSWFKNPPKTEDGRDGRSADDREANRAIWPIMVVSLIAVIVTVSLIEPKGWLRYESTGFEAIPAANTASADFSGKIKLIGYDMPEEPVAAGRMFSVTAYWKAQQPLDINYQVFVHVKDSDGNLVAQSDKLNPGDYPTKRWPLDKYVRDRHEIDLPSELPPGTYRLSVGLWAAEDGWRLPLVDAGGDQIDDNYQLSPPIVIE